MRYDRSKIDELRDIENDLGRLMERVAWMRGDLEEAEGEKARAGARAWAREVLNDPDAVIFDSETTGLRGEVDFVEVAVLSVAGEVLIESRVRPAPFVQKLYGGEELAREPVPIEDGAYDVHGIAAGDLEDAPTFAEVYPALAKVLRGKRVVVYNSSYDKGVMEQVVQRYGLEPIEAASWECAMSAYARFRAEWDDYHGGWRWSRLPGAEHGASADCRATLAVVREIAAETEDEAYERQREEKRAAREKELREELRAAGHEGEELERLVAERHQEEIDSFEEIPF